MEPVSDARLVVAVLLLMALSAGATICLTWTPQSSQLPRASARASESLDLARDNTPTTQQSELSRFWERVESPANVEVVLAYELESHPRSAGGRSPAPEWTLSPNFVC